MVDELATPLAKLEDGGGLERVDSYLPVKGMLADLVDWGVGWLCCSGCLSNVVEY